MRIRADGWLEPSVATGLYSARVGKHYQLMKNGQPLTRGEIDCLEPSLSRDSCLAYNRGGRIRLEILHRYWDLGPGYNPCLSADGKWLAFARGGQIVWRKAR